MSLAADDLQRLARLARLGLATEDVARYGDELNTILALVETLQSAATKGVEPMAHPLDMHQRLRPDSVSEPEARESLMRAAPQAQDGLFVVPRVIE
ncbi:MAG: Asp-tRNA(Asn)/Glu-tRNA(Gln) amidotransferase subunit GatC [Oceanococcaceae bacterium]